MKRNHQNFFSLLSTKAGAWAMVGAPKISSIQNFPSSSKSIFVLVYGRAVDLTALEVQIRIRVCDQLPSTFEMIEREELSQRSKRLSDPVTIGVTRSTAGKSLILIMLRGFPKIKLKFLKIIPSHRFDNNSDFRITRSFGTGVS